MNDNLRKILQEITDKDDRKNKKFIPLEEQEKAIVDLSSVYPHKINIREKAILNNWDPKTFHTWCYICFMYALDIMHPDANQISTDFLLPDKDFVRYCIINRLIEELLHSEANDGDIIIYFDGEEPKHAGKICNGLVVSKWGAGGHLWEHDVYEIPLNYGNIAKYYRLKPGIILKSEFVEYSKAKGCEEKKLKYWC